MDAQLSDGKWTILIVDDMLEVRSLIADFLSSSGPYTVLTSESGDEVLARILPNTHVDLIISDINMPNMQGFELLHRVRNEYANIKRILMTSYNVEEYLEMALKYDIGNIFVKTTPFNFQEFLTVVKNLVTGNIFGLDHFFETKDAFSFFTVKRGDQIDKDVKNILDIVPETLRKKKLELVLFELLTNAIFYGARNEQPEKKENWEHDFELSDKEAVMIEVAVDKEKYAVSITDTGGSLSKQNILYWLNRQIRKDTEGVPIGVFDSHGRGLYITRQYIDRLIINIDSGKKTEVVIINYFTKAFKGPKPLYINEL